MVNRDEAEISQPFVISKSITVSEAQSQISDEVAFAFVKKGKVGVNDISKKHIVNIDVLSQNFNADDTVDVDVLKEKCIVPKTARAIKILARGKLDKPLTVIADGYSVDAIKMIVLVGGTAKLN